MIWRFDFRDKLHVFKSEQKYIVLGRYIYVPKIHLNFHDFRIKPQIKNSRILICVVDSQFSLPLVQLFTMSLSLRVNLWYLFAAKIGLGFEFILTFLVNISEYIRQISIQLICILLARVGYLSSFRVDKNVRLAPLGIWAYNRGSCDKSKDIRSDLHLD